MTSPPADRRDDVCPPCSLGECGYCDGNIDLKAGPGPASPLTRCACVCRKVHAPVVERD